MKKKLILPFEDHPYSLMYHHCAFPMGVIQGNAKEDITPWLCGKYINCWFGKHRNFINRFTLYYWDNWAVNDRVIFKQEIALYPDLYHSLYDDEVMLLRKMLNLGYYPQGNYNEEHIPGKWAYQKEYFSHNYIIIGYDDIAKEFLSAGYLMDRKFQIFSIPYENMRQAMKTLQTPKIEIHFWKYNSQIKFDLNLNRIVSELSDYLNSTTSLKMFSDNKFWGMEAMQQLLQFYIDLGEEEAAIDMRYTRGVMEHKFYMHMRMEYLLTHDFLKDTSYLDKAQQVYQMAEMVHMLGLKYNLTGNKTIVSKIKKIMNDMLFLEKEYLPSVLSELQNYKGDIK